MSNQKGNHANRVVSISDTSAFQFSSLCGHNEADSDSESENTLSYPPLDENAIKDIVEGMKQLNFTNEFWNNIPQVQSKDNLRNRTPSIEAAPNFCSFILSERNTSTTPTQAK